MVKYLPVYDKQPTQDRHLDYSAAVSPRPKNKAEISGSKFIKIKTKFG